MTKTHAEFLEELKEYIAFFKGFHKQNYFLKVVCGRIINKIEQFQSEVKDDNK